jgi:tetratricopeptide (TPR) repeat protein
LSQPSYALLAFYLALNTAFSLPSCSAYPIPASADIKAATVATISREQAFKLFDQAVEIALKLDNPVLRYETLLDIAEKMAEAGEKTRALTTLKLAEAEVSDNSEALSELALQTAKLGQQKQASALFDKVIMLQQKYDGQDEAEHYASEENLVKIITKMAEASQFEAALATTKFFTDKLRQAEALNAIATKLISLGKLEEAYSPLSDALNITEQIGDGDSPYYYMSNGGCANYKSAVLSEIAQNLSLIGQLEKALATATNTSGCSSASGDQQQDYRVWAYSGILKSLQTPVKIKQVWQSTQTITPEDRDRGNVWGTIALKLIEVHETALAYDIAQKLASIEFFDGQRDPALLSSKDELLQTIAVKLASTGEIEKAQRLVNLIRPSDVEREAQALTFLEMASKLDPKTQAISIQALRSQAVGLTQQIFTQENLYFLQSGDRRLALRQQLGTSLTQQGQLETALKLANTIQTPENRASIISRIALALAEKGSVTQGLELARSIKDKHEKDSTLSSIASFLGTTGDSQKAINIIQMIRDKDMRLAPLQNTIPLLQNRLAIEQATLIAPLTDPSISQDQKTSILKALATRFIEIREVSTGVALTKMSKNDAVTAAVAKALVKNGNVEEGLQLLALLTKRNAEHAKMVAEIASDLLQTTASPKLRSSHS